MQTRRGLAVRAGLVAAVSAACAGASAQPGPIYLLFDLHADPMVQNQAGQAVQYADWVNATNWALDQADLSGAKVSFLSCGNFMEWATDDAGAGHALLRRLYASGGQIGTHSHSEYRFAYKQWRNLPANPTNAQIESAWADHVNAADEGVRRALGITDPGAVRAVNCSRGSHQPADDASRISLMARDGFTLHQQGPEEIFFSYFGHYVMNPFRPDGALFTRHDPAGPVILNPTGSVIGKAQVHFGIFQDNRVPAMKARFLLHLLNWLDDAFDRGPGADVDRIWTYGWGSHCSDYLAGAESRAALAPMLSWLDQHFVGVPVGGRDAAGFRSFIEVRDAYRAWETANPGAVSFSYPATSTDWSLYPYLRPVAEYLVGANLAADMPPVGEVRWHRLTASAAIGGPFDFFVAYTSGAADVVADLSASLGAPTIAALDSRTGVGCVYPADAVRIPAYGTILVDPSRAVGGLRTADFDGDGFVTGDDFGAFVVAFEAGFIAADFDRDGFVTGDDFGAFVGAFESGC